MSGHAVGIEPELAAVPETSGRTIARRRHRILITTTTHEFVVAR
jgi:hypothetical protein